MIDDEMDADIQRLIDDGQDLAELACKGVEGMIDGAIDGLLVKLGHNCGQDPALTSTYGCRLFMRALDELKARQR